MCIRCDKALDRYVHRVLYKVISELSCEVQGDRKVNASLDDTR